MDYGEHLTYSTPSDPPPLGVMDGFETRRVGSQYRLNELLPDTQTDTEIFSFNSFPSPQTHTQIKRTKPRRIHHAQKYTRATFS